MSASLFLLILSWITKSRTLTFHDVCFSKPWTFHNGFMFFSSRSCFKHFLDFKLHFFFLKLYKSAGNSNEKKKHETLWKVNGFEKQTSWKVSVLDCVFLFMRKRAKRVTPTCTSVCICIPWSWECVRHTTTTHDHTHDAHQPHTTKHPTKHEQHTNTHPHNAHTHRTPSKSKHARTRKMVNCAW